MSTERIKIISRFVGHTIELVWPFTAFQKTNDPHKAIENLERASGAATLWILGGILIEVVSLIVFPHNGGERIIGIVANAAIGFGLIVEFLLVGKVIDATREADRKSAEKIAEIEAQTAAARAQAAKAELELKRLGPRQLNRDKFIKELEGKEKAPVEIFFLRGNAESYRLATQIQEALIASKWQVSRAKIQNRRRVR